MNEIDLTICDREPIHIPGSIQPHGVMLVTDAGSLIVEHAAGDVEAAFGAGWRGKTLPELLGGQGASLAESARTNGQAALPSLPVTGGAAYDTTFHVSGDYLIAELEPAGPPLSSSLLPQLEAAASGFERAANLQQICEIAAKEFRRLTGYDRVMIYRFLDDDAGVVLAEDKADGEHSFLRHHFPAADIPKQARALYVRNRIRVIPDVGYRPARLQPEWQGVEPLDMSDAILRSVSPIHIQYLKNMSVGASASVSIVKDGALWGLIACHHPAPRAIPLDVRAACRALAGGLARQIKAREETDAYRERVRLRTYEDDIVALLSREGSLDTAISNHLSDIMGMLDADGVAVLRGADLIMGGRHPAEADVRKLAQWALPRSTDTVLATERLSEYFALSTQDLSLAAGLLAVTLSASEPWIVLWFRAEHVEVVNWAGNPHKNMTPGPGGTLNPRASFEAWQETVRGRARRWTIPEVEAAAHLRTSVMGVWQTRRIQDLNRQLLATLDQKDMLLRQKQFLIGEVNHRVQNSLQLVSSFLALQARGSEDATLHGALEEARRRIGAVSLVHRRLYSADQLETIDAARYVDELLDDLVASLGGEWAQHFARDLEPIMLPTDRAVGLGLVLTELVINANKYAYGGAPGPLRVSLAQDRDRFRLAVEDDGVGRTSTRRGFGSRMIDVLVTQLGGALDYEGKKSGTRAVLVAPIEGR